MYKLTLMCAARVSVVCVCVSVCLSSVPLKLAWIPVIVIALAKVMNYKVLFIIHLP